MLGSYVKNDVALDKSTLRTRPIVPVISIVAPNKVNHRRERKERKERKATKICEQWAFGLYAAC
jgi:hypothetical protein